jgi:hypothetical protein
MASSALKANSSRRDLLPEGSLYETTQMRKIVFFNVVLLDVSERVD